MAESPFVVHTKKKKKLKYLTEVKEANQDDLRPIYKTCLRVRELQENLSQLKFWLI